MVKGSKSTKKAKFASVGKGKVANLRMSPRLVSKTNTCTNIDNGGIGENDFEDEAVGDQNANSSETLGERNSDDSGDVENSANMKEIFLEVPRHHQLVVLKSLLNNGNNQRRCSHPLCTARPNKYCSGCSDVLGDCLRLVCFCNLHFPIHIASQCYNAYRLYNAQPVQLDGDSNNE